MIQNDVLFLFLLIHYRNRIGIVWCMVWALAIYISRLCLFWYYTLLLSWYSSWSLFHTMTTCSIYSIIRMTISICIICIVLREICSRRFCPSGCLGSGPMWWGSHGLLWLIRVLSRVSMSLSRTVSQHIIDLLVIETLPYVCHWALPAIIWINLRFGLVVRAGFRCITFPLLICFTALELDIGVRLVVCTCYYFWLWILVSWSIDFLPCWLDWLITGLAWFLLTGILLRRRPTTAIYKCRRHDWWGIALWSGFPWLILLVYFTAYLFPCRGRRLF